MSFSTNVFGVAVLMSVVFHAHSAEFSTVDQRFSYALGFQFAQQLRSQGIKVEGASFAAALDDVLQGNELQLTIDEMREAVKAGQGILIKAKKEQAQRALEMGEEFLAENKAREGVVTLPSGLQYLVLKEGTGETPAEDASVTVHYRGTLINGKEFDSSYGRGEPSTFSLGGVIPGFKAAISQMKSGARWQVFIPSKMAYGEIGAPGSIGPNETLIFEIELVSFEAKKVSNTEKAE
ncbi:FKBP-type peptidyl-prolyl cis-trans isomerase [Candidatus Vondammii sp. HM_W22]|uniref:FKBP-type peptidyl-prolyl cis-trans isomerase n=1 Tax=Candidatus Vondammii sp. HM_W22 TaxID=2687299 RepID=UPI001F1496A1|nr:FKBP-type peptidyl-prolyl cis-trans isomerase [Candidatus Vondammii sp. HM_W22]